MAISIIYIKFLSAEIVCSSMHWNGIRVNVQNRILWFKLSGCSCMCQNMTFKSSNYSNCTILIFLPSLLFKYGSSIIEGRSSMPSKFLMGFMTLWLFRNFIFGIKIWWQDESQKYVRHLWTTPKKEWNDFENYFWFSIKKKFYTI